MRRHDQRWGFAGLLFSLAFLVAPRAWGQAPSFQARVDRTTVGLNETFVYEVTLSQAGGEEPAYQRPDFRGFRLLGESPSQSTQLQLGGGGTSMQTVFSWRYDLQPMQKGTLTIAPARIRTGGRELRTGTVTIAVGDAAMAPPARSRRRIPGLPPSLFGHPDPVPADSAPSGSFVLARPDKTTAYVGEQVTVVWYLYLTERQDKYQTTVEPHTDGFWTEDIPLPANTRGLSLTQEAYQGHNYLVAPLMRKALFPLAPGRLTVSPLESEISQVDFFGSTARTERLKAEPVLIEALPLPAAGRPAGLDSASVGHLGISARVDRERVAVGEAVTVTVVVSGTGNLRKLVPPKLPPLDGWKGYDPKTSLVIEPGDVVGGRKTVEYLLLPERGGTTIIPAFELPFFDPATKTYVVEKSPPLRVEVVGEVGTAAATVPSKAGTPVRPGAVVENLLPAEIRPPRARPTLRRDLGTTFYRSRVFVGVLAFPPLALFITVLTGRVRQRLSHESDRGRRRKLRRLVRRRLGAAEAHMQAGRAAPFFIEIDRVLREVLAAQLERTVTGLSRDEVRHGLGSSGLPVDLTDRIMAELDGCDHARFAPGGADQETMRSALERSGEIILQMEKVKPGRGGAA